MPPSEVALITVDELLSAIEWVEHQKSEESKTMSRLSSMGG
jgi:hypothetical protein